MNSATISILVPFLNEEENLPLLYERTTALFDTLSESLELIFIDDGSTDGSLVWVKQIAQHDQR